VLIVMPFVFDMFNRAPKGTVMISGFRPFMKTRSWDVRPPGLLS